MARKRKGRHARRIGKRRDRIFCVTDLIPLRDPTFDAAPTKYFLKGDRKALRVFHEPLNPFSLFFERNYRFYIYYRDLSNRIKFLIALHNRVAFRIHIGPILHFHKYKQVVLQINSLISYKNSRIIISTYIDI